MQKIIVYGDKHDKKLSRKIANVLEKFGSVLYLNEKYIYHELDDIDFFVLDTDSLDHFYLNNAIIIFKNNINQSHNIKFSGDVIAVIEENNRIGINILKSLKLLTLTCGMANNDTLTLSSIKDNSAVVSVQRKISWRNKSIFEPCEIKFIYLEKFSNFEIMSICAVLLLLNKIDNDIINI